MSREEREKIVGKIRWRAGEYSNLLKNARRNLQIYADLFKSWCLLASASKALRRSDVSES